MFEFLLLLFIVMIPFRLVAQRENRRRHRLESAFHRASSARLSGIGQGSALRSVYGERFFNPR